MPAALETRRLGMAEAPKPGSRRFGVLSHDAQAELSRHLGELVTVKSPTTFLDTQGPFVEEDTVHGKLLKVGRRGITVSVIDGSITLDGKPTEGLPRTSDGKTPKMFFPYWRYEVARGRYEKNTKLTEVYAGEEKLVFVRPDLSDVELRLNAQTVI